MLAFHLQAPTPAASWGSQCLLAAICSCLLLCVSCSQLLTNHYERCWKYYCLPTGWANFGVTSEEELHLTRKLFWGIFDSLAHKVCAPVGPQRILCGGFWGSSLEIWNKIPVGVMTWPLIQRGLKAGGWGVQVTVEHMSSLRAAWAT